jgi:hypothetical protein
MLPRPSGSAASARGRTFSDHLEETRAKDQAYDEAARRRLRELSERLVGLGAAVRS